jgi:hypothetical protein
MEIHLIEGRALAMLALATLALTGLAGCLHPPDRESNPAASQTSRPSAPSPLPGVPTTRPLTDPSKTTHTPTSRATPEWNRPAMTNTSQAFANTIETARQDLASRLGLPAEAIQFIQLSLDEFPADNLGCLGPGVTPRPIPTMLSGQVILLEAGGVRYSYHARKEQVVFCGPWP